jgi:Na+/melibiose symporter-like transporter
MSQRSLSQRLFSIEVIAGALAGAAVPYLVALVIEVAPARVPVWLVTLCVGAGTLLTWLARMVRNNREKLRATQEREDREHLEMKTELEELKEAVASISAPRRGWPRRRNS